MPTYHTLTDAIADMRARGFVNTFTIQQHQLFCPELSIPILPEHLTLLEQHHVTAPDTTGHREVYGFRTQDNKLAIMTDTYSEYAPDEFEAIVGRCLRRVPGA
ncbi:hypothetical protein [Pontibacter fetidus]|uniref:Phosphoribosylpyrophosphate synthetase n=1 Tax=Pontibacter fetidus TaxID=2700082 RepID=A0A6B2H088_9BACT|nr:hypothetical protein [Pontibacter fetidus]NDK56495.1 hypothetical protein [Pontibacter fetidus]